MTLMEFCTGFFPDEKIFSEQDGKIVVDTCRLIDLEGERKKGKPIDHIVFSQLFPSDVLDALDPNNCWNLYNPGERDWQGPTSLTLSDECVRFLERTRLVIDPPVAGISFNVKYPYFRMRGRPVTEEQAHDILHGTSALGFGYDFLGHCDWVSPDGVVGINEQTGVKFPFEKEFMESVLPLKFAFPYLDLMGAVTDWGGMPGYAYDALYGRNGQEKKGKDDEVYHFPDFLEHIVYGVWLHDDMIELMAPERAREKYAEYSRLYGGPNEDVFRERFFKTYSFKCCQSKQ